MSLIRVGQQTQLLGIDTATGKLVCEQDLLVSTKSHKRVVDSVLGLIATDTKEQLWQIFKRSVMLKLKVKLDKKQAEVDTSAWL